MTRVCLIGGGGQLAEAASLSLRQAHHKVIHYRPKPLPVPGVPRRPARPTERLRSYSVVNEKLAKNDGGSARYNWVDRWEARRAEVYVYCLPSYLTEFIGMQLCDAMRGKYIVNLSDRFMGTLAMCSAARACDPSWTAQAVAFNSPPFLSYQRARDRQTSLIYSKPFVLAAPVEPYTEQQTFDIFTELVSGLFGVSSIRWMSSTLELAFENINSIVHAVQDVACLQTGLFRRPGFLYDPESYTSSMVRRIEAVAAERDAVAGRLFSTRYRDLATFDATTFATASRWPSGSPAYRHEHPLLSTVPRPSEFSAHGYEDVGWSMVPLEGIGATLGVSTPHLTGLIDEWNAYMKIDYRRIGRSAGALGNAWAT